MIEFQSRQIQLPDGAPVIVCRIKGSIDGSTLLQFEEKLLSFLDQGVKHLIVVFSQVRYIGSTGMGVLVKLADKFQDVGGDINLVDVPEKLVALFNMLGLLTLITLSKTEEEALNNFQRKRTSLLQKEKRNTYTAPTPPPPPVQEAKVAAPEPAPIAATPVPEQEVNVAVVAKEEISKGPKINERKKVFAIICKKCKRTISLGVKLRVNTYKCPYCKAKFVMEPSGKIQFS